MPAVSPPGREPGAGAGSREPPPAAGPRRGCRRPTGVRAPVPPFRPRLREPEEGFSKWVAVLAAY